MNVTRVSKTIPAKRYSNFPNIMNFDKNHGLKKCALMVMPGEEEGESSGSSIPGIWKRRSLEEATDIAVRIVNPETMSTLRWRSRRAAAMETRSSAKLTSGAAYSEPEGS